MKKTGGYLAVTFALAWGLQLAACLLPGIAPAVGRSLVSLCMFAPLLAVLVTHGGLRRSKTGIGWKPGLRRNWKWYLLAWAGPAALTGLGAALFFRLFPQRLDWGRGAVTFLTGGPALALAALAWGPLFNMLFAVGEEAGWRGYLTPALSARFGRRRGLLLSGAVWGAFHWPLIALSGYEYGTGYPGAPWTGMACMLLFAVAMGVFLSWLYEKTDSIWSCALCHGALNAAAGLPLSFLAAGETDWLLGPTVAGLVSGLPLFALGAVLLWKKPKNLDT